VLILGGGGAVAADLLTHEPCEGVNCEFDLPFGGGTVAGVFLVTAGSSASSSRRRATHRRSRLVGTGSDRRRCRAGESSVGDQIKM
jgi:hypothetical protein